MLVADLATFRLTMQAVTEDSSAALQRERALATQLEEAKSAHGLAQQGALQTSDDVERLRQQLHEAQTHRAELDVTRSP